MHREEIEDGWALGYIVATGTDIFAMELIDDSIRYDGYHCIRYADVSKCENLDPYAPFVEKAFSLRGLSRLGRPNVELGSLALLLKTANAAFPLVTIHLEKERPNVCYTGKVITVDGSRVELKTISPSAEWDDEVQEYDLEDITTVSFGRAYEEALVLVGGAG